MFAETAAIDGRRRRWAWMVGVGSVVLALTSERAAASVMPRLGWFVASAVGCALLFGAGSYFGFEALGIDDDVYLGLAVVSSAVLLALAALALGRLFGHPDALGGEP